MPLSHTSPYSFSLTVPPPQITKKSILIGLLVLSQSLTYAQSKAHQLSRYAIIDPAYDALKKTPEKLNKKGAPWIYGYSE